MISLQTGSECACAQGVEREESRHILEYSLFPDRIFDYITRFWFGDCPGSALVEGVERHGQNVEKLMVGRERL